MQIENIPPHQVVAVWPKVEMYLAAAMKHSAGEYDLTQLRGMLTSGQQRLLAFVEDGQVHGAITVASESYPNMSVAFCTAVGGHCFVNQDNADLLFDWCRSQGYTHVRGATFESAMPLWRRVGFKEIYRTVEVAL